MNSDMIYSKNLTLHKADLFRSGQLTTSAMFRLLQDVSDEHTEALGCGADEMESRGLLWIIARQDAEILRMPAEGEEIVITTWVGRSRHMIYPRYYTITDADGNIIVRARSIWSFMDARTRGLITADKIPFEFEGIETGEEIDVRGRLKKGQRAVRIRMTEGLQSDSAKSSGRPDAPTDSGADSITPTDSGANSITPTDSGAEQLCIEFTVPHEYIDRNGHMNNARYFDACDLILPSSAVGAAPTYISAQYSVEAYEGESLTVKLAAAEGKDYSISIESERGTHFRARILSYEPL